MSERERKRALKELAKDFNTTPEQLASDLNGLEKAIRNLAAELSAERRQSQKSEGDANV
jgi:ParB-like chromosome segregation protein Spo0J